MGCGGAAWGRHRKISAIFARARTAVSPAMPSGQATPRTPLSPNGDWSGCMTLKLRTQNSQAKNLKLKEVPRDAVLPQLLTWIYPGGYLGPSVKISSTSSIYCY